MPWTNAETTSGITPDDFRRRIAYYLHFRTKAHGSKTPAAEAVGINEKTLRRWADYNYPEGKPPAAFHRLDVIVSLIQYFGDDPATVFFAVQHSTDARVFAAMLHCEVYAEQGRDLTRALERPRPPVGHDVSNVMQIPRDAAPRRRLAS